MAGTITVALHHGGSFIGVPVQEYVNGQITYTPDMDVDYLSIPHMKKTVKDLGYMNMLNLWYQMPRTNLSEGLRILQHDSDLLNMLASISSTYKVLDIYVEHGIDEISQSVPPLLERDDEEEEEDSDVEAWHDSGIENQDISEKEGEQYVSDVDFFDTFSFQQPPESDYRDSSEAPSPVHSDEDEIHTGDAKYPQYKEPTDIKEIKLEVGQVFKDAHDAKGAVRNYAICGGFNIKFTRNASSRVTAQCSSGCQWYFHASWMKRENSFQCKVYKGTHTCARTFRNPQMKSSWIARKYIEKWRDNPEWGYKDLHSQVKEDFVVSISKSQACRAKKKGLELIFGKHQKQFKRIRDYAHMLLKTNDGSTVKILTETPSVPTSPHIFQRFYVCLDACKRGFLDGCRPFVGVDGCFLKGPTEGQLLAAVGRDANNAMFPIAFAIVEGETKDSWTWFFKLLLEDVGMDRRLTFMSDQQKGLVPALHELLPSVEHRFCWRHLYSNISKKHRGKHLRGAMWKAAKATTVVDWKAQLKKIKDINKDAAAMVEALDPTTWTRSAFRTYSKCNSVLNNMSESFNAFIIESRDKPIITCLEMIREALMVRLQKHREEVNNYKGKICPNIQKKIEVYKIKSRKCIALWSGESIFEVKCKSEKFIVNLEAHTCTCRKWDLTGIPCHHAVSAIFFKKHDVEDYVSHWYAVDTYKRIYQHTIFPVPSVKFWEESGCEQVAPPRHKRQPGRPKKLRRRDPDEAVRGFNVSKKGTKIKCSKCLQYGHNKTTCKAPQQSHGQSAARQQKLPVRKRGQSESSATGAKKRPAFVRDLSGGNGVNSAHGGPSPFRTTHAEVRASGTTSHGGQWHATQPVHINRTMYQTRGKSSRRPATQPIQINRSAYQNPTRWYGGYITPTAGGQSKGNAEASGNTSKLQT